MIRRMSSEQNSIRSSASSTAARAARDVVVAPGELRQEVAEHAEVLRLARVGAERRGRAEVLARLVDVAAPELQLGVAQEPVELLRAARRAAAPVDLGGGRRRLVPLPASNAYCEMPSSSQLRARARPGPRRSPDARRRAPRPSARPSTARRRGWSTPR